MGCYLKNTSHEKEGYCPYCNDGILVYDLDSKKIRCNKCLNAIKIDCISFNESNENIIEIPNKVSLMKNVLKTKL